jgi:hypothetical protein
VSTFLASQLLATCAFAAGMAAYQGRTRRQILRRWSLAAGLNAVHFALLGVPGATALTAITSARFLAASYAADRRVMVAFMVLATAGFLATYTHAFGFLALASTLLGTWASFQPRATTVRVALAICAMLWLVHNVLAGSPVAALMEVAFLASNGLGWWRSRARAPAPAD